MATAKKSKAKKAPSKCRFCGGPAKLAYFLCLDSMVPIKDGRLAVDEIKDSDLDESTVVPSCGKAKCSLHFERI
jgi:hypothetical protein